MVYDLIICRSLTYAQRTASLLERSGISSHILRTPRQIAVTGCSYSVKVSSNRRNEALSVLNGAGLAPQSVFQSGKSGIYQEVPL